MTIIIDKRSISNSDSATNRRRFIQRNKEAIKQGINRNIKHKSIKDISKNDDVEIGIDTLIDEPSFSVNPETGDQNITARGNRDYLPGSTIPKPRMNGGRGGHRGDSGLDRYYFTLSKEEFLEIFFEDMELPDLVKKELLDSFVTNLVRAGYIKDGVINRLNIKQTMINAIGRYTAAVTKIEEDSELNLEEKENKLNSIPKIDPLDLRFNHYKQEPEKIEAAVMFLLMDVSGSMDEIRKDLAKRFFILLYLFLFKNYKKVEVVFIRHAELAEEVDEKTFFYDRETGGTVISSGLSLIHDILEDGKRFPLDKWNIYIAQASDSDNYPTDNKRAMSIMLNLIPKIQYFVYVHVGAENFFGSTYLPDVVKPLKEASPKVAWAVIKNKTDVYPALHNLFKKRRGEKNG